MPMRPQDDPRDPWAYIRQVEDNSNKTHADIDKRLTLLEEAKEANRMEHNAMYVMINGNHDKTNEKLDLLLQEYHRTSGMRSVAAWVPSLMSVIVGFIAIYTFLQA